MFLLQVKDLSKKNGERNAVNDVSFEMMRHQKIAIAGETGSGKTTLLKMIGGYIQPDGGEVLFENQKVLGPMEQLIPGHPSIAYLSQHFELRNNYWVYELLEMSNKIPEEEATQLFKICQIEHLLHRRTNELSGGEKQRIVLAMQLIKKPKLLLLDEPFSNLDAIHEQIIKEVIHDVSAHFNTSCIMVSHDGKDVLSWADLIIVIQDGAIVQQATPSVIYHQPLNAYCAGLFGVFNAISYEHQYLFLQNDMMQQQPLMLRPEQLQLTHESSNNIPVTVEKVFFEGAHYMAQVRYQTLLLQTRTQLNLKVGEKLFIKPAINEPYFLNSIN
jgi:ABC-type sugar transport system ATPase subunit